MSNFLIDVAGHAAGLSQAQIDKLEADAPGVAALVHAVREAAPLIAQVQALPDRAVVIAAPATSYEILALAPVYVVAAPKEHVADTRANQPQERIDAVALWLRSHDPTIAQRYGATWAVEGGRLYRLTS